MAQRSRRHKDPHRERQSEGLGQNPRQKNTLPATMDVTVKRTAAPLVTCPGLTNVTSSGRPAPSSTPPSAIAISRKGAFRRPCLCCLIAAFTWSADTASRPWPAASITDPCATDRKWSVLLRSSSVIAEPENASTFRLSIVFPTTATASIRPRSSTRPASSCGNLGTNDLSTNGLPASFFRGWTTFLPDGVMGPVTAGRLGRPRWEAPRLSAAGAETPSRQLPPPCTVPDSRRTPREAAAVAIASLAPAEG